MIRDFVSGRMATLDWSRYRLAQESGVDHRVVCRFIDGKNTTVTNIDAMISAVGGTLVYRLKKVVNKPAKKRGSHK